MSLQLPITQSISCTDVISIAEKAGEVILQVYNSKVRESNRLLTKAETARAWWEARGGGSLVSLCERRRPFARQATCCSLTMMVNKWPGCMQSEDWNVEMKSDDSPLTRADQEANAVICRGLALLGRSESMFLFIREKGCGRGDLWEPSRIAALLDRLVD